MEGARKATRWWLWRRILDQFQLAEELIEEQGSGSTRPYTNTNGETKGKVIALGRKKHPSSWYLEINDYGAKTK
jgi:hypothetical protein